MQLPYGTAIQRTTTRYTYIYIYISGPNQQTRSSSPTKTEVSYIIRRRSRSTRNYIPHRTPTFNAALRDTSVKCHKPQRAGFNIRCQACFREAFSIIRCGHVLSYLLRHWVSLSVVSMCNRPNASGHRTTRRSLL